MQGSLPGDQSRAAIAGLRVPGPTCVRLSTRYAVASPKVNLLHLHVQVQSGTAVSDTVTATIAHRLGKVEALRRLKEGLASTKGHLGPMITMEEEVWDGNVLSFRMRALGQNAAATIEVLEDALRIDVSLPWLLAKAAKRLLPV